MLVSLKKQIIRASSPEGKRLECKEIRKSNFIVQPKNELKMIILIIILVMILILLGTTNSKAILQANATTHKSPASKKGETWITEIRKMETANQTMGLNETLNGLNATSASNGIDVHMMLPTEYGAVAILSASGYGNPKKLRDETNAQKRTTTGNSTGVYFTGDRWEISASYGTNKYNNRLLTSIGSIIVYDQDSSWHVSVTDWDTGGKFNGNEKVKYNLTQTYLDNNIGIVLCGGVGIFSCGFVVKNSSHPNPWNSVSLFARGSAC